METAHACMPQAPPLAAVSVREQSGAVLCECAARLRREPRGGGVPGKEGSFQEASRVGSGSVLPVAVCLVNVGILEPLAGWADPARPGARRAQGQDLG